MLPSPTDLAAACTFPAVVQARARGTDMPLPLQPGKHHLLWGGEGCLHPMKQELCCMLGRGLLWLMPPCTFNSSVSCVPGRLTCVEGLACC